MEGSSEKFMTLIKQLSNIEKVKIKGLKFEIIKVEETEYNNYCLTLKLEEKYIYKGIYIKNSKILKVGKKLAKFELYLNQDNEIKLYIDNFVFDKENKILDNYNKIEENSNLIEYDFRPENIISHFNNNNKKYYSDSFIVSKIDDDEIIHLTLIKDSSKFTINTIDDVSINDKIFIKNYSTNENNEIICDNLTIIKHITDYELFHSLETKIANDFYEINKIENNDEIFIKCLISKVIYKNPFDKEIKIIDAENRIIKIDNNLFDDLDLFDLILITNCKIKKSIKDEYTYDLELTENSIKYYTKNLFFDKRISLNNYTILDIKINDFKEGNNIFNKIILSDMEYEIKKERHIFLFKFKNEQFNEIIPYSIKCKNKDKVNEFKFFIMHNALNKANLFINYDSQEACCIDKCFINIYNQVKNTIKISVNDKEYEINHYNSFDSINRIGFILINIPMNEFTNRIKNKTNKNIISSQVWFTKENNSSDDNYINIQILDVDEAQPKVYKQYNLRDKDYLLFENVYETLVNFEKNWANNLDLIKNYLENLVKNDEIIEKVENLIKKEYNTDYNPDSADYFTLKLYISITLYVAFKIIKDLDYENFEDNCYNFLDKYIKLIKELNEIGNNLTYHQKIRIINCFCLNNANIFNKIERQSRLFYLKPNMKKNNSYKLAMNFNQNIIKNLNERSALTSAFLQLDSFILYNYLIDKETYTLTVEPLILMKNHLLLNYEDFIFINYQDSNDNIKASQNQKNRITFINEKSLFSSTDSESFYGKNDAFPVSIEFLHEKDSHAKKSLKNLHIKSPISCFKNNRNETLKEAEDGKFVESIIGEKDFIIELKNPENKLGELMKIEYFTSENFDELKSRFKELNEIETKKIENIFQKYNQNVSDMNEIKGKVTERKKPNELKTLKDYEDTYLCNGKFCYPDSVPFHSCKHGDKIVICEAEKEYLDKYKDIIEKAKLKHLVG